MLKIQDKYKGIFFIILSALCFATMSLFVRLSGDIPSLQKSFFRNFVAFFIALIPLMKSHVTFHGGGKNWFFLVLRSIFGTIGLISNYYAIDHLVLSDANMLNKMSPFFAIIFSFFLLKEKVKPAQLGIVCTAFLGSLLILKPTFSMEMLPALIGLLGGMTAGFAYTCVRKLGTLGEKGPCIVAFFSGFSCLVTLPYILLYFQPMTGRQLFFLLMAGVTAAGGQFSVTAAYTHAPAREISVYDYSQIIFSTIYSLIFFGELPDVLSFLGYFIIIGMAVLMFWYNNRYLPGKKASGLAK